MDNFVLLYWTFCICSRIPIYLYFFPTSHDRVVTWFTEAEPRSASVTNERLCDTFLLSCNVSNNSFLSGLEEQTSTVLSIFMRKVLYLAMFTTVGDELSTRVQRFVSRNYYLYCIYFERTHDVEVMHRVGRRLNNNNNTRLEHCFFCHILE